MKGENIIVIVNYIAQEVATAMENWFQNELNTSSLESAKKRFKLTSLVITLILRIAGAK